MGSAVSKQRVLVEHQAQAAPFTPTTRDLRWFAHIARHGPQSSEHLFELTRDTHRCRDSALRRLQLLRELGYVDLPHQQRSIAKADFNPFVHELGRKQRAALKHWGIAHSLTRPSGHWWHAFTVASITSAIDICATQAGHAFIPGDQILSIKNAQLAIPVGRHLLVPDQLFALRTAEGFRSYVLEMDHGTEPVQSSAARKSLKSSAERYSLVLRQQLHKRHYGLKSNLVVLWVFTSPVRRERFLDLVRRYAGDQAGGFTTQVVEGGFPRWQGVEASVRGEWIAGNGRRVALVLNGG